MLSGCKSSPESYNVETLDLLDANKDFFLVIPKEADPEFISFFLNKNLNKSASESTKSLSLVEKLSDRINKVYCGINHKKNSYELQVAIEENIPKKIVEKNLSKNKEFKKLEYTTFDKNTYPVFAYENMNFSFPDNNTALLGQSVTDMLDSYDNIKTIGFSKSVWKNQEMYDYLKTAENEIRFFSENPKNFLSLLIGNKMDLHLLTVCGSFSVDPDCKSQYLMTMVFQFSESKYLKAGKTLLNFAFGLTGSSAQMLDDNVLMLTGIQINKNQLYKLLVL